MKFYIFLTKQTLLYVCEVLPKKQIFWENIELRELFAQKQVFTSQFRELKKIPICWENVKFQLVRGNGKSRGIKFKFQLSFQYHHKHGKINSLPRVNFFYIHLWTFFFFGNVQVDLSSFSEEEVAKMFIAHFHLEKNLIVHNFS